jgi:stearoyl-CoA desaturase (delta-9 desaturase)
MSFLSRVLEPPSYGYERDGQLIVPTHREILREFFRRTAPIRRRNWMPLFSWVSTLSFAIPLVLFFTRYFSWPLLALGFVYSMVVLGTHGTIWYHRYSTHKGYQFSHPFWRELVRNSVVRIIPEELYVVSHHVHHWIPEKPGDPYNVHGGWLYCFLADVCHQPIAKDLSPKEYARAAALVAHTGVRANTYLQYQRWGSICHPFNTVLHFAVNWIFWYGVFYAIGGHALACALFGSCGVWAIGVRTFNYDGHGGGKDKRRDGFDFNRKDLSMNQLWPGLVTGEWHNNHHLFPNGARAGFLPYQLDYAWYAIRILSWVGGVSEYKDNTQEFFENYYLPYRARQQAARNEIPDSATAVPPAPSR